MMRAMVRLWGLAILLVSSCLTLAAAAPARAELTFQRPDGSAIAFHAAPRVWCGPWDADVAVPSLRITAGRGLHHWELHVVRRDLKIGRPLRFPNIFTWNRPRGAMLFVADAPIEASTAEEEASGSLTFSRLSCRRGRTVAFRIDAVLGSELIDGDRVRVSGTFRGRVRGDG